MNIAFAKIGKTIKFDSSRYTPNGGDNEATSCLVALATRYPEHTFYIIGMSDFSKIPQSERARMFPNGNVIDAWAGYTPTAAKTYHPTGSAILTEHHTHYILQWYADSGVRMDSGVMMVGQVSPVTIPGVIQKIDEKGLATTLEMSKRFSAPITLWLNEHQVPYVEVVNDPRYTIAQARDIIHGPTTTLTQYDYEYTRRPIKSYEDQTRVEVTQVARYAAMETLFCVGRRLPRLVDIADDRHVDFTVVLNEGRPSRYPQLRQWVLDNFKTVDVYGKWVDPATDGDTRFVGSLHIDELQNRLRSTKCTFIIPIAKGWVTSKYIEMIHAGVIPFFHPQYDTQRHIDVPDYLRPTTIQELVERVGEVSRSRRLRLALLERLQNLLRPEYYDGSYVADAIVEALGYEKHTGPMTGAVVNMIKSVESDNTLGGFFTDDD